MQSMVTTLQRLGSTLWFLLHSGVSHVFSLIFAVLFLILDMAIYRKAPNGAEKFA